MITQQELADALSAPDVRQMAAVCVQKMRDKHLDRFGAAAYNAIIEGTFTERLTPAQYWAIVHYLGNPDALERA